FLIAQQVGADLSHPMDLGARGNDIAKQRFGAFDVDGEIVIDEEDGHLAFFAAGALLQPEQFTNHALISTEANRVSEKSGHRAELAPVGTTSSGLDGNDKSEEHTSELQSR